MEKAKQKHPCTVNEIIKCELYLLDALNCDLMIYHPYIVLPSYAKSAGLCDLKVRLIMTLLINRNMTQFGEF